MKKQKSYACSCSCGGSRWLRLIAIIIIMIGLGIFGYSRWSSQEMSVPTNSVNASANESVESVENTPTVPTTATLDENAVKDAAIIEYNILSSAKSEKDGLNILTVLITPKATWQGDFDKERITATMLDALAQQSAANEEIVNVIFLPTNLKTESMYKDVALGYLVKDNAAQEKNELKVVTRGYLPQELDFMALYDEMQPQFTTDGVIDSKALNEAIVQTLGPATLGMEYPFLNLITVENVNALLKTP